MQPAEYRISVTWPNEEGADFDVQTLYSRYKGFTPTCQLSGICFQIPQTTIFVRVGVGGFKPECDAYSQMLQRGPLQFAEISDYFNWSISGKFGILCAPVPEISKRKSDITYQMDKCPVIPKWDFFISAWSGSIDKLSINDVFECPL